MWTPGRQLGVEAVEEVQPDAPEEENMTERRQVALVEELAPLVLLRRRCQRLQECRLC